MWARPEPVTHVHATCNSTLAQPHQQACGWCHQQHSVLCRPVCVPPSPPCDGWPQAGLASWVTQAVAGPHLAAALSLLVLVLALCCHLHSYWGRPTRYQLCVGLTGDLGALEHCRRRVLAAVVHHMQESAVGSAKHVEIIARLCNSTRPLSKCPCGPHSAPHRP